MKILSMCYFLVLLCDNTLAVYKRWLPDTNFENPNNWNAKRAPCGNDVVTIPHDSPTVYVQLNTTIQKLILPPNGELILGLNVGIGFTDSPVAGCEETRGDLEFDAVHPVPWLNPTSWCTSNTELGKCDLSVFMMDIEKVPCSYDDVVFPKEHSYFVDLSEDTPSLTVKTVKISGDTFVTSTLTNFMRSSEGQRMFKLPSTNTGGHRVNITRRTCGESRGCPCGNDKPEIERAICRHIEGSCSRPRCGQTIQPVGACCKMCGAVFNITRGYGFDFNSFVATLKRQYFASGEFQSVSMSSLVTSEGWVQTVLADVTGNRSVELAQLMYKDFVDDYNSGGHKYAMGEVPQLQFSGYIPKPSYSPHSGETMSAGSVSGIVIGVIAVLAIIVLIVFLFIFRRSGREIPIPKLPSIHQYLPHIPRRTPRATALVLPEVFSQPRTAPHIDPGFANPLYDSSPFDDGNFVIKEMELIAASTEQQPTFDVSDRGFHNPLFGTSGVSVFSDPARVEEQGDPQAAGGKVAVATTSSSRTLMAGIRIDNPSSADGDSTI